MDNEGTSNRIETGYTLGEDSNWNREKKSQDRAFVELSAFFRPVSTAESNDWQVCSSGAKDSATGESFIFQSYAIRESATAQM